MQNDDYSAATEFLNEGREVPPVESSFIEHLWKAVSCIPPEERWASGKTIGIGASTCADPASLPSNPEQHLAVMARSALLQALRERGALEPYIQDDSGRKKVFNAAASFPFDKNDLFEAMAPILLRSKEPEAARKFREECQQAGLDLDHPKVVDRFIEYIRNH